MTGRVGGTTTMLLGLVGGAAVGFVIGRCVCRFSLFQRLFEKKLKYLEFEQALNAKENRDPIVAGLSDEFGLTPTQADALLTQCVAALKTGTEAYSKLKEFREAANHPPTGAANHGLVLLTRSLSANVA
jgi:hypothetical protein